MVKCYTIQQHLPTITYEFQTHLKYCVQQTDFKYKIYVLAIEVYYRTQLYTYYIHVCHFLLGPTIERQLLDVMIALVHCLFYFLAQCTKFN